MGGVILNDEKLGFDLPYTSSSSNEAAGDDDDHRTIVLVGRTGNGKSATGNSILGRKAFLSSAGPPVVTLTTQLSQTQFPDGQTLTVIARYTCEILKCFRMARAGVHSILVVFSLRNRFTKEEEAVIHSLKELFGKKIHDYIIVVFTNEDDFDEEEEECFEDNYLFRLHSSQPLLKEIIRLYKNRTVLFDNRTKDKENQTQQRNSLLAMVEEVRNSNGGRPYTNKLFQELERADKKICDIEERTKLFESVKNSNSKLSQLLEKRHAEYEVQLECILVAKRHKEYEEKFKKMIQTVESEMNEANLILKQQLIEEKATLLNAEENVTQIKSKLMSEIDHLKKARGCSIM